ncbi:MAG: amidase [Anaerolineae bacterium]|nr:amidase [Anaerolineae bacterium]
MAIWHELAGVDGVGLAELVQRKEVKPIELVEATIERIERVNPEINAVVIKMYDIARDVARDDTASGPFAGVPYLIKDLTGMYGGILHTAGSKSLKDSIAMFDSTLVARMKEAGLNIIGKTNTPEFGLYITTEPLLWGPTRNPWNTEHIAGGSSGGAAAAVAAGILPWAHASDGGGSIRLPASCCGLLGLKPTRARLPLGPIMNDISAGLVACEGAITVSVRDCAALLDALSGPEPGDPYWAPPPARPFIEEVGVDPGKLRIAFTTRTSPDLPVHADCVAAVEETARLLEGLGHEVVEDAPALDWPTLIETFRMLYCVTPAKRFLLAEVLMGQTLTQDDVEPQTWAIAEIGKTTTAAQADLGWVMLGMAAREFGRFLSRYDLLLTPTTGAPPPKLGALSIDPNNVLEDIVGKLLNFAQFTWMMNNTGLPAISVPLYWNKNNLPIGSHFVAKLGDEATLLRLAAQLELAKPWASTHPPVWAYQD